MAQAIVGDRTPKTRHGTAAGMETWTEPAPAKTNLYLHVLGRRSDGYHLLDSLVAFASIGDRVAVSAAGGFAFAVEGPYAAGVPTGDDNLVVRAAHAYASHIGRPLDAHVTLTKMLPPASGIGGGSADAAAVIRALATLWGTDVASPAVLALCLALGADVPVCLHGRATHFAGIGETLGPDIDLPRLPAVLINPGRPVSTPAVFKARATQSPNSWSPAQQVDKPGADVEAMADALTSRRNDLEAAAIGLCPVIDTVLAALKATEGCRLARMSGSGATCFGLFATEDAAARGAERIGAERPDWWVRACVLS